MYKAHSHIYEAAFIGWLTRHGLNGVVVCCRPLLPVVYATKCSIVSCSLPNASLYILVPDPCTSSHTKACKTIPYPRSCSRARLPPAAQPLLQCMQIEGLTRLGLWFLGILPFLVWYHSPVLPESPAFALVRDRRTRREGQYVRLLRELVPANEAAFVRYK
jgi:hypothetical protein